MCHLKLHCPTSDFATWRARVDYPCRHTDNRDQHERAVSLCNQFKDGAPNGNMGEHRIMQCYWIILCERFVKWKIIGRWWTCEKTLQCHWIVLDTFSDLDNNRTDVAANSNPTPKHVPTKENWIVLDTFSDLDNSRTDVVASSNPDARARSYERKLNSFGHV